MSPVSPVSEPTLLGTLEAPLRRGDPYIVRVLCPYCGAEHTHGAGLDGRTLGHRVAHCTSGGPRGYMIAVRLRDLARTIPCPTCDAQPGSPCMTRRGRRAQSTHGPRYRAALP